MRPTDPCYSAPTTEHLKRLMLLRNVLAVAIAATIGVAVAALNMELPWGQMVGVLLLLPAANLLARYRLRQSAQVGETELFLQLLLDVAVLSALLYLSGGSTNPFVSLYLLPLVIAATTLRVTYALVMATITTTCYGLLFYFHLDLAGAGLGHEVVGFRLHLVGMWVNFVLSAAFIAFFVTRMAQAIRKRDAELARQRQQTERNEHIVALGTLAAGAAHELGTPLSTMAVVLSEMMEDYGHGSELSRDLSTLRQQVDVCKQTITRMIAASGQARAEGGGLQPVDEFLRATVERWRMLRPSINLTERMNGPTPVPQILTEQTLRQAIVNLLNNAADASPHRIELDCSWSPDGLRLEIRDRGPGLSAEAKMRAGHVFFSGKPQGQGNGIGLLLAKATLERLGGRVSLTPREGGGVRTLIELPLASVSPGGRS